MDARRRLLRAAWGVALLTSRTALAAVVEPPVPEERVDAVFPSTVDPHGPSVEVVVVVDVDAAGAVTDTRVAESGGEAFDAAALEAARRWRFRPARRDGRAVAARGVRLSFRFAHHAAAEIAPPGPPEGSAIAADVSPPPASTSRPTAAQPASPDEVEVRGRRPPPGRGASDFNLRVGELRRVYRANAGELLKLAPGILLTNEGGEGHAQQVFLRGFDAREGQDIAFSVDGVPINDAGHLHGNGYADTHFVIPETVQSLRVLEGPFDPRQGNFAVAGSADYQLGLERRGLTASLRRGSFDTTRLLLLWGPPGATERTFGAAELYQTAGFGQNRGAERGSAVAQYEGRLPGGAYRLTAQGYATKYQSAGFLRHDDLRAGRVDFYGTYDPRQGGSSNRFSVAAAVDHRDGPTTYEAQAFVVARSMRLLENFTGFLEDDQDAIRRPHPQRGDLLDLGHEAMTLGLRGHARHRTRLLGRPQEIELGAFARGDRVDSSQQRLEATTSIPYRTEIALASALANVGLWADAELRPAPLVTLRGGARADLFTFDVDDRCAADDVSKPSLDAPPGDASCLSQTRFGNHREPNQRATTVGTTWMPRGTLELGPVQGFRFSASYGQGVRSIDPIYVTQDVRTPFASVEAYEGGVAYSRPTTGGVLVARSIFFRTHVDRDLIFNPTAGRATLADGTTRTGWAGSVRLTNGWLDESANVSLVRSVFDDTRLLVPYVPDLVVRSDTALHHPLPLRLADHRLDGALAVGTTFVGRRALPFGQRSQTIFTVDVSATVAWRSIELGLIAANVADTRYRLNELSYASSFRPEAPPTLVPVRHFTAGAPRALFATLTVTFGGPSS